MIDSQQTFVHVMCNKKQVNTFSEEIRCSSIEAAMSSLQVIKHAIEENKAITSNFRSVKVWKRKRNRLIYQINDANLDPIDSIPTMTAEWIYFWVIYCQFTERKDALCRCLWTLKRQNEGLPSDWPRLCIHVHCSGNKHRQRRSEIAKENARWIVMICSMKEKRTKTAPKERYEQRWL